MTLKSIGQYREIRDADKNREKQINKEIRILEGQLLNAHNAYVQSVEEGGADNKLFKTEKKAQEDLDAKKAELSAFQEVMSNRPKSNPDRNRTAQVVMNEVYSLLSPAEERRAAIVAEMEKLKESCYSLIAEYETIQREEVNLQSFLKSEGFRGENLPITREFFQKLPIPDKNGAIEYVRKNVTVTA